MGQGLTGTKPVAAQPVVQQVATSALPALMASGALFLDTSTGQLKVKNTDAGATYTAIGAMKAQGSYSGTGTAGRVITCEWQPDLVVVTSANGRFGLLHRTESTTFQSFSISGLLTAFLGGGGGEVIVPTGFKVGNNSGAYLNENGVAYQWTAFKFV